MRNIVIDFLRLQLAVLHPIQMELLKLQSRRQMSFFKLSTGKLSAIKILKCVRMYFERFWGNWRQTIWGDASGNDRKISKADLLRLQCDKTHQSEVGAQRLSLRK